MAVLLNTTDIHLSNTAKDIRDRSLPLSLVGWVKSPNWSAGPLTSMIGIYRSGTTGVQLGTRGGGAFDVWNWGGVVTISTNGIYTPPDNTWVHLGYTWDGTQHRIYANGSLITFGTNSITAGVITQVYINGFPTGGVSETSDTTVDDVSYYARAISDSEMMTIATSRGQRIGITEGLIARYRFDEVATGANATSIIDHSGNGLTLLASGAGTAITYADSEVNIVARPAFC